MDLGLSLRFSKLSTTPNSYQQVRLPGNLWFKARRLSFASANVPYLNVKVKTFYLINSAGIPNMPMECIKGLNNLSKETFRSAPWIFKATVNIQWPGNSASRTSWGPLGFYLHTQKKNLHQGFWQSKSYCTDAIYNLSRGKEEEKDIKLWSSNIHSLVTNDSP